MTRQFFVESFDPLTGERIVTDDDCPISGTFEHAAKQVVGIRIEENHWTYNEDDGSVAHYRLTEAAC